MTFLTGKAMSKCFFSYSFPSVLLSSLSDTKLKREHNTLQIKALRKPASISVTFFFFLFKVSIVCCVLPDYARPLARKEKSSHLKIFL